MLTERFWSLTGITDDCWLWNGYRDKDGYGEISDGPRNDRRRWRATHLAWWIATSYEPSQFEVIGHVCDIPSCVRNDDSGIYTIDGIDYKRQGHLFLGTVDANNKDCWNKGRYASGTNHGSYLHPESVSHGDKHSKRLVGYAASGDNHGLRLHPECVSRGEDRWSAKLRESDVIEIRALYAAGNLLQSEIASRFNITEKHVSSIVTRRTWKHIIP